MNAATEFDLGPLTWVKGEIDLALERAEEAFGQYVAETDVTRLKFCRTHVHQVHGALSIIGLDGLTQVTESLESLLDALENGSRTVDEPVVAAVRQAMAGIRTYLDELMAGEPNQPLRLLPVYLGLAQARGIPTARASDLFFPDLSLRPPKRLAATPKLTPDDLRQVLKTERSRYQKGLLSWLTKPDQAEAGRQLMMDALTNIEATQETQAARSFWWTALAFIEALKDPAVNTDGSVRQVSARIDQQIRRLLEGSNSLAERLMREALYHVAQATGDAGGVVSAVQSTFGLPSQLPAPDAAAGLQPQDAVLRRLREILTAVEEQWNRVCSSGSTAGLPAFGEQARAVAALTEEIGQTDLKRLGQGLGAVANWLTEDVSRFGDTVAMEVATAILLLQNAQESFKRLGTDFAQQVDLMVARLYACIAGKPAADAAMPVLDEMTRRAQEKLLISQVAREIQNNLAQVEQALDAFFRDPSGEHDLALLDGPLKQTAGALAMLGHLSAAASVTACVAQIHALAAPGSAHAAEDFENVAGQLSTLGFFVDALPSGETDFDAFVARLQGETAAPEEDDEELAAPEPTVSVESELARQARDTQALVEALKEAPQDERLQEELKQNLKAIQQDADLVANHELGESAKAALEALKTGDLGSGQVDAALAALKPQEPELLQPSAETQQLAESSHEEIDAELLSIFLEEAEEVLATMGEQKAALVADPHNVEALTTIRRNTHTLKGSGRMVGLNDLGEAAWELEQTLNLWLRQDQWATPDLMQMIEEEHALFSAWVLHLASGQGRAPDASAVVALAGRLRGAEPLAAPAAVAAEPALAVAAIAESAIEPVVEAFEAVEPATEKAISVAEPLFDLSDLSIEAPAVAEVAGDDLLLEPALPDEPAATPSPIDGFEISFPDFAPAQDEAVVGEAVPEASTEQAPVCEELELTELPGLAEEPRQEVVEEAVVEEVPAEVLAEPATEVAEEVVAADLPPTVTASPTLYDIFREEARGHLQTLVDSYGLLEVDPAGPTTFDMTRAAHTLGGIAATVGLMPIHHLAIALEHALLRRDGSAHPASIEGLETVRQTIITLEDMFDGLARQEEPGEQAQLIDALGDVFHPAPVLEEIAEPASAEIIQLPGTVSAVAETEATPEPAAQPTPAPALPHLTDELDEQLLPIFLEEAVDLTRDLTTQLRAWRADPASQAAAHGIARLLHTFKGSARMAGAMNLGEATHMLEARVEEAIRAGSASPAFIEEIESGCDMLAQAVERLREGPHEAVPVGTPVPAEAGEVPVAAAVAVQPTAVAEGEAESDAAGQRATLRVRADLVDRLVNEAGELSIARTRIEGEMRSLKGSLLELTENVIRLRRQLREIEIQAETQIQARVAHTPDGEVDFDPLELDRFTRFQELTRFMAESVNDVATVQQNLLKNLDDANAAILAQSRLNRSLQQELMGVRMLPFASQTERLYRIVRQTAKELGKRANLDIVGGQVDIDRSVLDKMLAPLEHMLRNAVAHGIETREQRQAAGKPEVGEITIKLAQEGNEIILAMSDDGKGLDSARIRARAEAMGLLQPGQPIDEAGLYDFIFQPGFSTAAELTQLAGRGVGMDVVKTEVSELGGRIEILSEAGKGTTFRLYLPLTLAVTQTLLVRAGSHLYAVPSTMIEQVMEMKEKGLTAIREQSEVNWQGNRYPFHFLPHLLGDAEAVPEAHRQYWVLLLRSGSQRVAVLVDELKGNQEVVVKNIGAQLARVVGIAGATVLGDGRVVLILNPVALASRSPVVSVQSTVPVAVEPAVSETESLPTVMVVDDSLTVRKITSRLLMREGYQVILAKDGVDALEQLIDVMPDVVLSDIEMPRMDGFDLVRNIRADERLRGLPMIMITSRTADKHRNYALEIGANHYLGKPYDEAELLDLVAGYTQSHRTH
ncbi:Hpt domain-containing protein [Dechloromonas sp. XY25]|uniref:histidine kinase n=1 Tax=Dechloromonas hankyongensis TaxID=2908002 RepID=A0ABS9JX64_9RHOO|nr:Hpt domain-containing protein [Dechloromonas hankyongensis]MCG2575505.1 Hpt domain-containing protein [Dechloromonas hankyongensis]